MSAMLAGLKGSWKQLLHSVQFIGDSVNLQMNRQFIVDDCIDSF